MKKELSAIEKMMAVKTAMEAFGFDFDQVTVGQAFTMFGSIKQAIEQNLEWTFTPKKQLHKP